MSSIESVWPGAPASEPDIVLANGGPKPGGEKPPRKSGWGRFVRLPKNWREPKKDAPPPRQKKGKKK
jgi:hypothetical protein